VSHPLLFSDDRLPSAPSAINPEQVIHVRGRRTRSETPREMTRADIQQAISDYRGAAQIAQDAGFDGVTSAASTRER
jgi:N-ethylmaleimide reductase